MGLKPRDTVGSVSPSDALTSAERLGLSSAPSGGVWGEASGEWNSGNRA